MPQRRALGLSLVAGVLAACGSINPKGDIPESTTLVSGATLRVSPNYSVTIEQVIFSAAGAALLYYIYDPLAPNWTIKEEQVAEDTYRLSLLMKRFHIGGDGEALAVFRRRAGGLQLEDDASGYQILDFVEGIESSTPFARRYAVGTVRLRRGGAVSPALTIAPTEPAATALATVGATNTTNGTGVAAPATDTSSANGATPQAAVRVERKPLPRPPPAGGEPALVHEATINARALFAFDEATLTPNGKAVLERELVSRRADLGQLRLLVLSGHADRIGSFEYNQRLSEARAIAVRDYLVSRGFRRELLQTVGYGKTRAVLGVGCPESLSREAQIACLAPHRRVEVSRGE